MNIVGLITEHNPYHNGHLYHVRKAREECEADLVVSVMSGHFLQRGEPALFNKWARAEMAVRGGVDLVIELPTAFSVRSAATFAHGSVSLLHRMGVITHICFGSEAGSTEMLLPAAQIIAEEPPEFKKALNNLLDQGTPYPAAYSGALTDCLCARGLDAPAETFASPNNILGIEYLKSLIKTDSSISPIAIKRFAAGYHDSDITQNSDNIASATSIREQLLNTGNNTKGIKPVVPATTLDVINREIKLGHGPVFINNYSKILFYLLRTLTPAYIATLTDVSEGLENRIIELSRSADSVGELLKQVKTKRYPWTRIQRILSYILLNYTDEMAAVYDLNGPQYIRVLGLSARGRAHLKKIKKQAAVPVITRTSPYLNNNDAVSEMLKFDIKATDIYTLLYPGSSARQGLDCKIMPFYQ